ncbi:MAG: 2-amino-4-hydroxy-6-hydroxymethyldihydropteridine diphosphokinase [Burkholderiales bacterium]|nr:2-amino-4-hydroxy-6-hydroxymethyldihydropteridine diphosphokinase [Burkholderiales bacterium]
MHTAFIALGSNLDDPEEKVHQGIAALAALPHTRLSAASSLYRSAPVGHAEQPDFVNAVAQLATTLAPQDLLAALLAIEKQFGRVRSLRNGPRVLDLDLLLYDAQSIDVPGLAVPHPRMHQRAFVLAPLLELAPACVIPGIGPAADWLAGCADQAIVRLTTP